MDKLLKLIDNKIEEVATYSLADYEIRKPFYEYSLEEIDPREIDRKAFAKMLYLYFFDEMANFANKDGKIVTLTNKDLQDFINAYNIAEKNNPYHNEYLIDEMREEIAKVIPNKTFKAAYQMARKFIKDNLKSLNLLCAMLNGLTDKGLSTKEFQSAAANLYVNSNAIQEFHSIRHLYEHYIKQNNEYRKEVGKMIKGLKEIKKVVTKLPDFSGLETIDFELLECIDQDNPDIYKYIFGYILSNQKETYEELINKENKIINNKAHETLTAIFKKHNIDYEQIEPRIQERLEELEDFSTLEEKLELLKINNNFVINEDNIKTVLSLSMKDAKNINYLLNARCLSTDTLFSSFNQIISNYEELTLNANLVLRHSLERYNSYNDHMLMKPFKYLKANEDMLSLYRKETGSCDYFYINNPYQFDVLDILIENGIDINSFDNYELTPVDIKTLNKRLIICNELDIDINTKSGNLNRSFLLGKNFPCSIENLDEHILTSKYEDESIIDFISNSERNHINNEILTIKEFEKLEQYKSIDDSCYEIGDVSISRNKVMRNLTLFLEDNNLNENTILQSIIYNSNLNDNEIEVIKSKLFDTKSQKKKA